MTPAQATAAAQAGIISPREAAARHSITAAYIRYQIAASAAELRRDRIDLLYLHNPEHGHADRDTLLSDITRAFAACEEAAAAGQISGYGIATWHGLAHGAFTIADLLTAAHAAAGGTRTRLAALQLPASLVHIDVIAAAAARNGPVTEASAAGLETWASAPLAGGQLPALVTPALAARIRPGLTPAQAALLVVASAPGLTGALLSASTTAHWAQAAATFAAPPIPPADLREICAVLRAR